MDIFPICASSNILPHVILLMVYIVFYLAASLLHSRCTAEHPQIPFGGRVLPGACCFDCVWLFLP